VGQKFVQGRVDPLLTLANADDPRVRAELVDHLTTGSAWAGRILRGSIDDDGPDPPSALRDHLENRVAFGAAGQSAGRILDIAAGVDLSGVRQDGSPDGELAGFAVGVFAHDLRFRDQVVQRCFRDSGHWFISFSSNLWSRGSLTVIGEPVKLIISPSLETAIFHATTDCFLSQGIIRKEKEGSQQLPLKKQR